MRKTLFLVLGFAVCCAGAQADENDYAKERLAQAERLSNIFELAERPFVLEADLMVLLKSKEKGHVKIAWQSKDQPRCVWPRADWPCCWQWPGWCWRLRCWGAIGPG